MSSLQLEAGERSKARALDEVHSLLDTAAGSDLVLLPELWPCGYFAFDRYAADAEPIDGPLVRSLAERARRHRFHLLAGSIVEREGDRLFNTALLLDDRGEVIGRYRKVHLFGHETQERRLLTAGEEVVVVTTPWGRAGLSTCYDLRFPELYRAMIDRGAELLLVTAAWPAAREEAWVLFNRARAHENLAWLLSCNAAGESRGHRLAGRSLFVDPSGTIVADAGESPGILTRELDLPSGLAIRQSFPALEDRRGSCHR